MSTPSFIEVTPENSVLFKGKDKEFVAYIPEKYFERNIAEQEGDYVNLLGIFSYTIQDLNTGKNNGLKNFKLPTIFCTRPSVIEKQKQIQLIKNSDPTDYRIFRYRDGDILIVSTQLVQGIGNVEKLNNLFCILGYIPNTIAYDTIYEYFNDAMKLNGYSYGVNNQVLGFLVSEVCRSIDDPTIPWRLSKTNDVHAFKSMSLKGVSKLISPYTAILSEDFDESVMYAMMNDNPKETSLERVLIGGKSPNQLKDE